MKTLVVLVSLVFGMFGLAYGQLCPSQPWPCDPVRDPEAMCSCQLMTLDQMGSFDSNGNWIFDSTFHQQLSSWLSNGGIPMNDSDWAPREFLNWAPNTNWGLPQLQVQYKEAGQVTRIFMQLPSESIGYPEIYKDFRNGVFNGAFRVNFAAPDGCVPPYSPTTCQGPPNNQDPNPCCHPWTKPNMTQHQDEIVQFSEIESIKWYQGGTLKGTLTQADVGPTYGTFTENVINVNYTFETNQHPQRGKFSYWSIPNSPSGVTPPWRWQNFSVIVGHFPLGIVPDPNVASEFTVRITKPNLHYGQDYVLHFLGGNTSQPPLIPLTVQVGGDKVNKKGKVKDKEIAVSTANIMATEVDGNLVIQWGEAVMLEPYWQIRVFVGDKNAVVNTIGEIPGSPLAYAIIEVPPPAGAAVLPAAAWSALKSWIASNNDNRVARVSIFYRRMYQNSIQNGGMLQVRSQSNYIEVPF